MAHATVSRCLRRRGISRRPRTPRGEVRRFEWPCPGDLLQMDVKRFARFTRPGHAVTGDRYQQTLAREMGLRTALPLKQRSRGGAPDLADPLQHRQEPQRDRQPTTDQPHPRSEAAEAEHLGGGARR
jgi:hypothetical protein